MKLTHTLYTFVPRFSRGGRIFATLGGDRSILLNYSDMSEKISSIIHDFFADVYTR